MFYQLGVLCEFVCFNGMILQYIKLYGVFYMYLVCDEEVVCVFVQMLCQLDLNLFFFCMYGLVVWCVVQELQQVVVCEFYVDCDYDNSGFIVFICCVGVFDLVQVVVKVLWVCCEGVVWMVEGCDIFIVFDFVCIYSDIFGVLVLVQVMCKSLDVVDIVIVVLC